MGWNRERERERLLAIEKLCSRGRLCTDALLMSAIEKLYERERESMLAIEKLYERKRKRENMCVCERERKKERQCE